MIYTTNPYPAGRPYSKSEAIKTLPWGAEGLIDVELTVGGTYSICQALETVINGMYVINSRYTGTEPTIEDIYSSYTYRYMALGCLDGPLFSFKDIGV